MQLYENYSLLPHNTFGIDVLASSFAEYNSIEELQGLIQSGLLHNKPYFSIGAGSNILFTKDFQGIILHSCIKGYTVLSENDREVFIQVGAGEVWDDFVAYCVKNDWCGVENLSLIPGEIGACAVQNIGAYGVEVGDVIESVKGVDLISGEVRELKNSDCCFGYRESIFKQSLKDKFIVTQVTFRLSKITQFKLDYGDVNKELEKRGEVNLASIREVIVAIRSSKLPDPKEQGNAGSFFKNPVITRTHFEKLQQQYPNIPFYTISDTEIKIPAAWLIDQAGWKGKCVGDAAVHDKQTLVIINKGKATGKEVLALAEQIVDSVQTQFGISISPEVIIL